MRDPTTQSRVRVNLNESEAFEQVQVKMQMEHAERIEAGEPEDEYFYPIFNNMNPLERKYLLLETSSPPPPPSNFSTTVSPVVTGDFFYMQIVKSQEVSDLLMMNGQMDVFLTLIEPKFLYDSNVIEKGNQAVITLLMWLSNIQLA